MKTRNSSNSERRNSVSDIADYFKAKMAADNTSTNKVKNSVKPKEKTRENPTTPKSQKTPREEKSQEVETTPIQSSQDWDNQVSDNELLGAEALSEANHVEQTQTQSNEIEKEEKADKEKTSKSTQTTEDVILQELRQLKEKLATLDDGLNHPKNGVAYQLAKQTARVDGVYSDIHGAVDGLKVQVQQISAVATENTNKITRMETSQKRITALLDENKKLLQELKTMKGLVQKLSQQTNSNTLQVMDLTKRGMEQNLIIQGIDNSIEINDGKSEQPMFKPKERCKFSVLAFLKDIMSVDLSPEDIWKAHRTGTPKKGKVRPMVVKLSYTAKDLIMENMGSLKGKTNAKTGQTYFISEQIPEGVMETRKQVSSRLKDIKAENDKKPQEQRQQIQVINDKILLDGQLDQPEVKTPQPSDLFVNAQTQELIDSMQEKFIETEPVTVKNSQFTALALKVHSIEEVKLAYVGVMQRYPSADHVMAAYALKQKGALKQGGCDD